MNALPVIVVCGGAALGAWLRWVLALWLNPLLPSMPLGTLAANLVGGLLVGVASVWFTHHSSVPPEWRLLVMTGFLGGLTTFSTFSLEVVNLLSRQEHFWALCVAGTHLVGSLALTALGFVVANALFARG